MSGRGTRFGLAAATKAALLVVSLGVTTALRFVRLFPNNDPIMAVMLPCSKRGRVAAVAFPVAAMVLFDVLSRRVGVWTAVTAGTYGILGLAFAHVYRSLARRGRNVGTGTFLVSGIAGVLVFDFVTGPVMSSLLFRMSFGQAFIGQIPFTLWHLASVSAYAVVVSPALDWALREIERGRDWMVNRLAAARAAS